MASPVNFPHGELIPKVALLSGRAIQSSHPHTADITRPILEKFNVTEINPGECMSAQLSAGHAARDRREMHVRRIGRNRGEGGEVVPLPPDVDSMEKVIALSPVIQQMVVRNALPDERVHVERLNPNHFRMILNLPLPPLTIYG